MVCTTVYSHLIRKSCYADDCCQEVFALKKYDLLVENILLNGRVELSADLNSLNIIV